MLIDLYDDFLQRIKLLHSRYPWFSLQTPQSSITNSELFYIYQHIVALKPDILFESGIANGRSTVILAECMRGIGEVIAAKFYYPDDDWKLHDFSSDYDNLSIVEGRGEDVARQLPNGQIIAVVDGPKPGGEEYGRPGWCEITRTLNEKSRLMFQHDVKDGRGREIFESMGWNYGYISRDFLLEYPAFGAVETWKETIPNLGFYQFR